MRIPFAAEQAFFYRANNPQPFRRTAARFGYHPTIGDSMIYAPVEKPFSTVQISSPGSSLFFYPIAELASEYDYYGFGEYATALRGR